ncbi:MAG TPA: hypothetical protein VFD46_04465 [Chryseolinea sp.]|nr:hypothetical protein [Chryseolinea sp.]
MNPRLLLIAAVLLLISLAWNWIQWRSANLAQRDRNLEAKEFRNRQAEALTKITQRDTAIQALLDERMDDSVRHIQSQSVLKTKINRLLSRVTGPAVVQDTVILIQKELISDLENEKDTLYITDNQAIDSLQKSNNDLKTMFADQFKESIRLQGQLDREKKRRWSLGPSVSYGVRGADVGISVQYSLFKF